MKAPSLMLAGQPGPAASEPESSFATRFRTLGATALVSGIVALACIGQAGAAPAASYSGSQSNLTDWRTTTVDKPLDVGGDDVIGTLGYHLFGAAGERTTGVGGANGSLASLPSYITVTNNAGIENQYTGYASIDNPVDGTPPAILSGTTDGGSGKIATITFGAGVPSSLTMVLMHDNLNANDARYDVKGYTIRASDGTTILATINADPALGAPTHNRVPDWHYVALTGLAAGDSIQVWKTASFSGNNETLGAVAFDVATSGPTEADNAVSFADFSNSIGFNPTGGTGGTIGLASGSFAGFSGGQYTVEWSPDLVTAFIPVPGMTWPVAGTGTSGTAGVQIPWSYETNDPKAFFRLKIE